MTHSKAGRGLRHIAAALGILAWFLYFSWDRLRVPFSSDDLMNLDFYWRRGLGWLVYSQFPLWQGYYRPMGGVFYLPLFQTFGLNPAAYHIAVMLVLLANAFLLYRLAILLGSGELAAGLAALIVCYHAGLGALYYYTGFVFDVLCFFFSIAALIVYVRVRMRGRLLGNAETAAFLGLFLCALNSKEIAATLPAVLLVYEGIYHRPALRSWEDLRAWLRGPGRVALFGSAMVLLSLYGKLYGPDPLIKAAGYRPVFSLDQVRQFQSSALADLFLNRHYSGWGSIVAMWLLLSALLWRRDRPVLRFCWCFLLITPLPVEFLPNRAGANLYLPLAGAAIFGAVVFADLAGWIASNVARAAAVVLLVAGIFLWGHRNEYLRERFIRPAMAQTGSFQRGILRQFQELHPQVAPGSRIAIENDPVEPNDPLNGLETYFIADLWFHDRSVTVYLQRLNLLPPEELSRLDHKFTFEDGRLVQVK